MAIEIKDIIEFTLLPGIKFVKGNFFRGLVVGFGQTHKTIMVEPSKAFAKKFPARLTADGLVALDANCCRIVSSKKRFEENEELLRLAASKPKKERPKKKKTQWVYNV